MIRLYQSGVKRQFNRMCSSCLHGKHDCKLENCPCACNDRFIRVSDTATPPEHRTAKLSESVSEFSHQEVSYV